MYESKIVKPGFNELSLLDRLLATYRDSEWESLKARNEELYLELRLRFVRAKKANRDINTGSVSW